MSSLSVLLAVFLTLVPVVQGVQHFSKASRDELYSVLRRKTTTGQLVTDKGVVQNCDPDAANFTVWWEPKILDPSGSVTVHYNYTTPAQLKEGQLYVALYIPNVTTPVFENTFKGDCNTIKKYLPVKCPLSAGYKLQGKLSKSLSELSTFGGNYKIKAQLTNGEGRVMFCAVAHVSVKDTE